MIGLSPTPLNTTAPLLSVDTVAPAEVTFQQSSVDNRISLGTLGPLSVVPIWIKRTTSPGTDFKEYDNFILKVTGKPFA